MKSTETNDARPASELVIEAIADHAGVDPLEFETPLGEVVDPDALDSLFTSQFGEQRDDIRVEFTYETFRVTVHSESGAGVSVDVAALEERTIADSALERQQA